MLQMDVGGRHERVDARALGVFDGLPARADIALGAAGQAADDGALHLAGDRLHGGEISGAAGREAGFDHVYAQAHQLMGDLQLLRRVQAAARRLLAVAQSGVEEDDGYSYVAATRGHGPTSWLY